MNPLPAESAGIPQFALGGLRPARALALILAASAGAFLFLVWLVFLKPAAGITSPVVRALPAVNAGCNALSTLCLIGGWRAARRRDFPRHFRFMSAAFASSTLFLICYIIYHNAHGDTRFTALGWIRPVYFFILISHITLSGIALPLILMSFYLALSGRRPMHRRVSRFTLPIWLYVSVTGVLVFGLLKLFNP
jgi:putative membrane protein